MIDKSIPSTMRAWKCSSNVGGFEKNLRLHTTEATPQPSPTHHLIRVVAVSLNPFDYKPAEAAIIGRLLLRTPMTPGFDMAGVIVSPADGSDLQPGQLVHGVRTVSPVGGGALAEYILAPPNLINAVPAGVTAAEAAGVPIAGVTAYCSLAPYVRTDRRVFLNGGSGGVGTYAIQIAKALGAHVTVSCSARNANLCRELGADEVLDYNASPILGQLQGLAPFDHVVDNVFNDPELYWQAHTYTTPSAKFAEVASGPSLRFVKFAAQAMLLPTFLGGGKRKLALIGADVNNETIGQLDSWMKEGKVKTVVDQVFHMEQVPEAFARLKTGRARGKIIVEIAGK